MNLLFVGVVLAETLREWIADDLQLGHLYSNEIENNLLQNDTYVCIKIKWNISNEKLKLVTFKKIIHFNSFFLSSM